MLKERNERNGLVWLMITTSSSSSGNVKCQIRFAGGAGGACCRACLVYYYTVNAQYGDSQSVKVHFKSSSSLVFVFTASISQFAVFFSVCFTIYLDIADAAAAAASIDWQSKAEILRVAFV